MKKALKILLATAIYVGFILAIQDAGEEVGSTVGELVADGIEEIPAELDKVKSLTKRAILKAKLFLKKIRDKVVGTDPTTEEDVILDKENDEETQDEFIPKGWDKV